MSDSSVGNRVRAGISRHSSISSALVISIASIAAYARGLSNGFLGDDNPQILDNPVVHSLSNFFTFFAHSTFYGTNGGGVWYRPIQTTAYSVLYSLFGPHATTFHVLQLALHIANAVLLYLVLRRWFRAGWTLSLSLLFAIHPVNSQAVFAIASLQDVLYFFFGMAALLILIKRQSLVAMAPVAACLFLSLLSKETGILFVFVVAGYLWFFDRTRLKRFAMVMALPLLSYFALKLHAVGLAGNPHNAPIDNLSLSQRLFNMPSLFGFLLIKIIWPLSLSSSYYWTHPSFGVVNTVLPLVGDLMVVVVWAIGLRFIRRRGTPYHVNTFMFFSAWCVVGLGIHLQIVPLDMTLAEPWLYFPMVGFYGSLAVVLAVSGVLDHVQVKRVTAAVLVALLAVLVTVTTVRASDWRSMEALIVQDIKVQPDNYLFNRLMADKLNMENSPISALQYAQVSIREYPSAHAYEALGLAYYKLKDYLNSSNAYITALSQIKTEDNYIGMARALVFFGTQQEDLALVQDALNHYPNSGPLWEYLAILQYKLGDAADARTSIAQAYSFSRSAEIAAVYNIILSNQTLNLTSGG